MAPTVSGVSLLNQRSPDSITIGFATAYDGAFRDTERFRRAVRLLWFGAGTAEERFYESARAMHESPEQVGIPNVFFASPGTNHEWQTWRRTLHDFAPGLFR